MMVKDRNLVDTQTKNNICSLPGGEYTNKYKFLVLEGKYLPK